MLKIRQIFKSSFLGKTALFAAATMIPNAAAVFLTPIRTKFLNPNDYGILGVSNAVSGLAVALITLGMAPVISIAWRDNHRSKDEFWEYYGTITTLTLSLALLVGTLIMVSGEWGWRVMGFGDYHQPYPILLWMGLGTILSGTIISLGSNLLMASENAKLYAVVSLSNFGVSSFLSIGFLFMGFGIDGQVAGATLGTLASSIILFFILRKFGFKGLSFVKQHAKDALSFGLPLVPHLLSFWVMSMSSQLIIVRYADLGEVGLFTLAIGIGSIGMFGVSALAQTWSPRALRFLRDEPDAHALMEAYFSIWIYIIGVFVVLGCFLSPFIVDILANEKFSGASKYLPYILLSAFAQGIYQFGVLPMYHLKKTRIIPLYSGVASIACVVITFLLVHKIGVFSAAVSMLVANLIMAVIFNWKASSLVDFGYRWWRIAGYSLVIVLGVLTIEISTSGDIYRTWMYFGLMGFLIIIGKFVLISGKMNSFIAAMK